MGKPKAKPSSNAVEKLTRRPPKNVLRIKMGNTDRHNVRNGKLSRALDSLNDPDYVGEVESIADVGDIELSDELLSQIEEVHRALGLF